MKLFDTHAHLNDARFDGERDEIAAALPENDVALVVDVATNLEEAKISLALAAKYANVYAAVGFHPQSANAADYAALEKLLRMDKVVALGEIGLDYHYDDGLPHKLQQHVFDTQLALAEQLRKPIIVHDREAHGDTIELLRLHAKRLNGGILHCFSGSYEMAKLCIDMGLYISFAGPLTFQNAVKQREIASKLPLEWLLVETDCPYLTPEPLRGKRNEPKFVRHTVAALAAARGIGLEQAAAATMANGRRVFNLPDDD